MNSLSLITYAAASPRRAGFLAAAYLIGAAVWLYYCRYHRPPPIAADKRGARRNAK